MKARLVCHVLNEHKAELFKLLDSGKFPELVTRVEQLLNAERESITDKRAVDKCITTMKLSVRNPNRLASTLWTWMNPSEKVGM